MSSQRTIFHHTQHLLPEDHTVTRKPVGICSFNTETQGERRWQVKAWETDDFPVRGHGPPALPQLLHHKPLTLTPQRRDMFPPHISSALLTPWLHITRSSRPRRPGGHSRAVATAKAPCSAYRDRRGRLPQASESPRAAPADCTRTARKGRAAPDRKDLPRCQGKDSGRGGPGAMHPRLTGKPPREGLPEGKNPASVMDNPKVMRQRERGECVR